MSYDNLGSASCVHCGATFRLFTIFKKDMQGLCRAWKRRHERVCAWRSHSERRKWARKYEGKTSLDSSLTVDISHPGFKEAS